MARRDESGATLVLALVFLVAAGGIIIALLGWGANNLENVAHFQQGRTLQYAADSATEVAIQNVRYSSSNCPSTYSPIPVTSPSPSYVVNSPNPNYMDVWCSTASNPDSAASRVVTLTTCSDTARFSGTCSQSNPYLTVVVTFDDYASSSQIATSSCTTTCGTTMTINKWAFE